MEIYVNVRKRALGGQSMIVNVVEGDQQRTYEAPATRRSLLNLMEDIVVALRHMENEAGSSGSGTNKGV